MAPSAAGLLGAAIRIGSELGGIVRGVLVDGARRPVLLRIELAADRGTVYVPVAALERDRAGEAPAQPHVVLGRAEAAFYEGHGFEWISRRGVSTGMAPGIVAT